MQRARFTLAAAVLGVALPGRAEDAPGPPSNAAEASEPPLTARERAIEDEVLGAGDDHDDERDDDHDDERDDDHDSDHAGDDDSDHDAPDKPEAPAPPKPWGPFFRGTLDASAVHVPVKLTGVFSTDGAAAQFHEDGHAWGSAFGGRIEAGYAFAEQGRVTIIPRGALSLAKAVPLEFRRVAAGVETSWALDVTWWSLGAGVEFRFPEPDIGLSAEVGTAAFVTSTTNAAPQGLELENTGPYQGGFFGRLAASVRFPKGNPWGAGLVGAGEGFVWWLPSWDGAESASGFRATLGVFAEWDGSRR